MAQSALTVTTPSPTPPTNITSTGSTLPNPATFDPTVYVSAAGDSHYPRINLAPFYDDSVTQSATAGSLNENVPPSGTTSTPTVLATNKGALAVGGTSVGHEGGTVTVVTAPGSRAECPTLAVSVIPVMTPALRDGGPNAAHASYLSAATLPTITSLSAGGVSGAGTTLLTVTGTNFTRASVVYVDGVLQTTQYVSATSITVTNAPKKATAGNSAVTVQNGAGGPTTAPTNWVFT